MTKVSPQYNKLTSILAVACETVYVKKLKKSNTEMVARISVVNADGECVYDTFIKPLKKVAVYDCRTDVTGITSVDLQNGEDYIAVRDIVKKLLNQRIAVGHSIAKHLPLAGYNHLKKLIRDITELDVFRKMTSDIPTLKSIAKEHLDMEIPDNPRDTVTDARAAMKLYQLVAEAWEECFESDSDSSISYYRNDSSDYWDSDWIG